MKSSFAYRGESRLLMVGLAALALALAVLQAPAVQAAPKSNISITVDTATDDNSAGFQVCTGAENDCSLRGAISLANSDTTNAYTIIVPAGTYTLTILGSGENANATGDLDISASLTISGAGAATTIINGNHSVTLDRVFHVTGAYTVSVLGVTITGGQGDGGGINNSVGGTLLVNNSVLVHNGFGNGGGGAIINNGTVTIMNSTISDGSAGGWGGALYNSGGVMTVMTSTVTSSGAAGNGGGIVSDGTLTITNSSILSNTAGVGGGGIANMPSGRLSISNSTISGNKTTVGEGGGINHGGIALTIDQSTIANNQANGSGGGILSTGPMTLTNSTVYSNTGALGGGIYAFADGLLVNDTFSQNWTPAGDGGGIELISAVLAITNTSIISNTAGSGGGSGINVAGGIARLKNTLVANNPGGNCGGGIQVVSNGNNISSDATCSGFIASGDQTGVTNPGVGPLANNGGPTQTHALLPGSPAIEAGSDAGCPSTDQRGVHRPRGAHCDIGAFEALSSIFLPLILR